MYIHGGSHDIRIHSIILAYMVGDPRLLLTTADIGSKNYETHTTFIKIENCVGNY